MAKFVGRLPFMGVTIRRHRFVNRVACFCVIVLGVVWAWTLFLQNTNFTSAAVPIIEDIQPNNGPIAGGTVITVTGSGFKGEYERVEALVFDGASYIDTGVPVRNKDVNARFFMNTSDTTTVNMVFGTNGTTTADRLGYSRNAGAGSVFTVWRTTQTSTTGGQFISATTNNDMTIDAGGTYHINGSQMSIPTSAAPSTTATLRIGGAALPAAYYRGRLLSIATYSNAQIEHNFMPVRRVSDGAYGVVDMVTRQFYGNSGTGTISGGSTVEDVFVEGAVIPGALSPDEQTRVLIDGKDCTGVTIMSDTELTCHTPSGESLGQKDVTLSTASGDTTVVNGFEYALRLNAITPKYGEAEGGNTIEIDGGVFSVPPEQYVSVEGIVFDGISWIETGFNQLGDIKMSVTFTNDLPTTPMRNVGFFGARTASSTESFVVWQGVNSATMRTDYGGASSITTPLTSMPKPNIYRIDKDNGKTTVYRESDGATIWNPAAGAKQNFTTPVNMLLGSLRHGAAYGTNGSTAYGSFQGTIYSAYICKDVSNTAAVPAGAAYQTDDERCGATRKLVRDFRPGYRETDEAYGFYDMVTGEFIENAGFGRFTPSGETLENELEVPLVLDVQVGGQACTNPQLLSPVKISCVVPASNLPEGTGKVDVTVSANGVMATPGTSDADDYYYGAPMVVDSISPNRGALVGGQVVTIHGSNFFPTDPDTDFVPADDWGSVVVTIGGQPCTIQQAADYTVDTIVCTTSAHAGGISDVFVDNTEVTYLYGGSIDPITGAITSGYLYEDDLISVAPTSGPSTGGTLITIRGNNFLTSGTTTQVFLSGAPATNVTVVNGTTITARTPPHAPGLVDILVSQNGYAASLDRTVAGAFSYYFTGSSGALSPNRGYISGGDTVTITGSGFDPNTTADVTFGGIPATDVLVVDATTIRLTAPAHAKGLVDVIVTQYGIDSTIQNAFTYVNPLTITLVNPGKGSADGGTVVTILGESFVPIEGTPVSTFADLVVMFGDVPCNVSSAADYTDVLIRCTTAAHVNGLVDVMITTGNGSNHTDTLINGFEYVLLGLSLGAGEVGINASMISVDTGSVGISVFSGSASGYNLYIQADDGNANTSNDNWLKCTISGSTDRYTTLATAGALTENTWGFNVGASVPVSWRPVPVVATALVPKTTHPSGPAWDGIEADSYQLWYGVKTGYTQRPCTYSGRLVLTLIAS